MRLPPAAARLALLSLLAAGCGGGKGGSASPAIDFTRGPYVPVPIGGAPVDGPADAWVTAVEFLDYACPYCANEASVVTDLRAAYPVDLRVSVRFLPVHSVGWPAARAAWCARQQGLFWEMHDSLFAHQSRFSDIELGTYAAAIPAMDLDAWSTCYASDAAAAAVEADYQLGLASGVRGTPTFIVNGKLIEGFHPLAELGALVDQAKAAAEASGHSRADYYDRVVLGL